MIIFFLRWQSLVVRSIYPAGQQYNVQDNQLDWTWADWRQDDWIETTSLRVHHKTNKNKEESSAPQWSDWTIDANLINCWLVGFLNEIWGLGLIASRISRSKINTRNFFIFVFNHNQESCCSQRWCLQGLCKGKTGTY